MKAGYILLIVPVLALVISLLYNKVWLKRAEPKGWYIGSLVNGVRRSKNLPTRPTKTTNGWKIELSNVSELHAVTIDTKGLNIGDVLEATIRVSNPHSLFPVESPLAPALVSLFFQRKGDNWSGTGEYEHYRWYSRPEVKIDRELITLTLPLIPDGELWGSVMGQSAHYLSGPFGEALKNAMRVGLVFGWQGGRSHGLKTTYPCTIELVHWSIIKGE